MNLVIIIPKFSMNLVIRAKMPRSYHIHLREFPVRFTSQLEHVSLDADLSQSWNHLRRSMRRIKTAIAARAAAMNPMMMYWTIRYYFFI